MAESRVTQVVAQTLEQPSPNARVTQVVAQALQQPTPNARVTQVVVQVLTPNGLVIDVPSISDGSLGAPTLVQGGMVQPSSIATAENFGTPNLVLLVQPSSIASAESLGAPSLLGVIQPSSIASVESFGTLTIGGRSIVFSDGIPSAESFSRDTYVSVTGAFFKLYIAGRDRSGICLVNSMRVSLTAGSPATASFRLLEPGSYKPLIGSEVVWYVDGVKKFAGFLETADEEVIEKFSLGADGFYYINCNATDYTKILQRRYLSYNYEGYTRLKAVLEHVVSVFLADEGVSLAPMVDATLPAGMDLVANDVTIAEFLDDLKRGVGRDWWIDFDRILHFEERAVTVSTFRIDDYSANWRKPRVKHADRLYRNTQGVRTSALVIGNRRETLNGTGKWTAGSVLYTVSATVRPRVWLNGVAKNVAFMTEMGTIPADVFFRVGERGILFNSLSFGSAPTSSDEIIVEYVPQTDSDVVWQQNADGITARASRAAGSGRVQVVAEVGELTSEITAQQAAAAELVRYNDEAEVSFESDSAGDVQIGHAIEIDSSRPFIKGAFIVTNLTYEEMDKTFLRYQVTATGREGIVITGATNATPIVITTEIPHGLVTGNTVSIFGAEGNTAANLKNWPITVTGDTTMRLAGTQGNGTYTGGGYLIAGFVTGKKAISTTSGTGVSPIEVTTVDPHEYPVTTPGEAGFTGINIGDYPTGSIGGITGNTAVDGTGHVLIPTSTTKVLIGPMGATGGIDISTIVGNGTIVTVTTIDAHDLVDNQSVLFKTTPETALNDRIWPITVTGTHAFTLVGSSGITTSLTGGTLNVVSTTSATASGNGTRVRMSVTAHGLTASQQITITSAPGFAAILGNWKVVAVDANNFDLQDSPLTGSSSDVVYMTWPIANGTAGGTGSAGTGKLSPGLGLPSSTISSVVGSTVTTAAPHGITTSPNWPQFRVNLDHFTPRNTTIASAPTLTTFTVSPAPTGSGVTTGRRATPGGGPDTGDTGDGRTGHGGRGARGQLGNIVRRTRGKKNRTIERATFLLSSSIPGYSAAPLQVGANLTNEYVVVNDGVFLQVVVFFKSPPLGAGTVIDILANGVSILTAAKITYLDGQVIPMRFNNFITRNLAVTKNTRLTIDVISVGTDFAGCDGSVHVLIGTK